MPNLTAFAGMFLSSATPNMSAIMLKLNPNFYIKFLGFKYSKSTIDLSVSR